MTPQSEKFLPELNLWLESTGVNLRVRIYLNRYLKVILKDPKASKRLNRVLLIICDRMVGDLAESKDVLTCAVVRLIARNTHKNFFMKTLDQIEGVYRSLNDISSVLRKNTGVS